MIPKPSDKCFLVMPKGRKVMSPGRFSFMDGNDLKGIEDLDVYEAICQKSLHKNTVFIFECIAPAGCYSCDRDFVDNYVFETLDEARNKIASVLKSKIKKLQRKLTMIGK